MIAVVVLVSLMPNTAKASHALGGDITYECTGPNTYNVVLSFYRDCQGITPSSTQILYYESASCGLSGNITLTQSTGCVNAGTGLGGGNEVPSGLCGSGGVTTSCNNGTFPGVQIYTYCATLTLPAACPDWVISYSECCRNSAITNLSGAASYDQYIEATINNSAAVTASGCNNSPIFTNPPSGLFCAGFQYCYNHGVVDFDGDSLAFTLITPLDDANVPIPYAAGYSQALPMQVAPGTFSFDPGTGQICFEPTTQQAAVITVQVDEYRNINGVPVLVGTTMRDVQFQVLSGSNCSGGQPSSPAVGSPTGAGIIDSVSVQMCPGNVVTFDVTSTDPNGNLLTMTSNVASAIPGATFTVTPNGTDTFTVGTFTWAPGQGDAGLNFFTVTVTNDACPIASTSTSTIRVFVYEEVTIASSSQAFCGDSVQLNAIGGSVFTWSPTTGMDDPNSANPKVAPGVPTWYKVVTDCGEDSIYIDVTPPYTVDAGPDAAICLNGLTQLNATTSGAGAQGTYAPVTYQWRPAGLTTGLDSADMNRFDPPVSPSVGTTYYLTATNAQGCVQYDSVYVDVVGVAPSVTAFVQPDTVCPGGTVQLDVTATPQACGASIRPCITNSLDYTVGTGTSASTSTTSYPAPYGNFYRSARHQMLYTAAELQALGLNGGTLTSLALDIANINGTTVYCNFTIKVKCVSANSISAFDNNGLVTVFTPKTINIATGWNTHTFDTPYDWDGVSNLLVDICFDKTSATNSGNAQCNVTYTNNSNTRYTSTPFTSVVYSRSDVTPQCGTTSNTPSTSSNRPNARFGICQQGIAPGAIISWAPAGNIIGNPNDNNPLARIYANTTFIVSVDEGGCVGQSSVNTYVDNSLQLEATPQDTGLCNPGPVLINANAIGTPSPITLTCGANGNVCGGPSSDYTLGSSGAVANQSTPYAGDDAQHIQMLFRGSELTGAGMSSGIITDLMLNVAAKNSSASFNGFTISIGCTNSDTLGAFETGLTTVYGPINVTTTAGANTYTLDAPYDWDGFANLVIDIAWDNGFGGGGGASDVVVSTSTLFSSVIYQTSFFGAPNPSVLSSNRPDLTFSICPPPPGLFTYLWTPSTGLVDPVSGLPTDTGQVVLANVTNPIQYIVEVTDGNCVAYDTVDISFFNTYLSNAYGSNIGCAGNADGDLISTPTGGNDPYDFEWSDGTSVIHTATAQLSDTVTNLPAGTYYLTMTDASGCQAFDTITLTVPDPLVIDSLVGTNINCFGQADGSAAVYVRDGTPPYTFTWNSGDTVSSLTNLLAGNYIVTVTDSSGCQLVDSILIIEPAGITYAMASTPTACYQGTDGTASVTVTGGGSGSFGYLWSDGQTSATATNLTAGTYIVSVTDLVGGCEEVDSVIVAEPDSFIITTAVLADASCFNTSDGSATADVGGITTGYTFEWSSGETGPTAVSLSAGVNTVTVTVDSSGCPQTATVTIGSPARFFLLSSSTETTCPGGADGTATVTVTSGGTPPFTYEWSNGQTSPTATGLTADSTYIVTVTDGSALGCQEFDTVTISGPVPMVLDVTSENAACFNEPTGSLSVEVTGGTFPYTYAWSSGDTEAKPDSIAAGTYTIVVTDANGCVDSVSNVVVSEPTNPLSLDIDQVNVSCPGNADGGIFVQAEGGTVPYYYSINGGTPSSEEANYNLLPIGDYLISVTDSNGCVLEELVTLTAPDEFSLEFDPDHDTINIGESLILEPIVQPYDTSYSYSWQPAIYLDCDTCENPESSPVVTTPYELTVYDENGCRQTSRFTVYVENDKKAFVPNVFTPNGDGLNDTWVVRAPGAKRLKISVWDKWGELVYRSNGPLNAEWDGTYKGKVLPADVFVYYIEVEYLDLQKTAVKGSVTILK